MEGFCVKSEGCLMVKRKKKVNRLQGKQIWKKRMIFIASICMLFILSLIVIAFFPRDNGLALEIEDITIHEEQMKQVMDEQKSEVANYFYKEYDADVTSDFWTSTIEGEKPYELLIDEAVDELEHIYANYVIAYDKGYVSSIHYEDIVERWEAENESREKKVENGEPIYGLKEYPFDIFMDYEIDQLQKMYMEDATNEAMVVSGEDGKAYYEANKEKYFSQPDDMELAFIKVYYGALPLSEEEVQDIKKDMEAVASEVKKGADLEDVIAEEYESLQTYYEYAKVSSDEYAAYTRSIGDVFELTKDIEKDEQTEVIDQNDALYFIQMIDREVHAFYPYERMENNVVKQLKEEKFATLVEEKKADLHIEMDKEALYQFAKDQLSH